MIFKNLIIQGFQSHPGVELTFSKGVNVICGLSHSGKTAILRAMNLVINNRPRGESFINWDMDKTTVGLVLGDDEAEVAIVRTRGRDSNPNSYTIEDGSVEPPNFDAPGVNVPEPVAELLNMGGINIQKQLSPYYLVLNSPGEIAKQIRKTAGLDQIDRLVRRLDGTVSTHKQMEGIYKDGVEEMKKNLAEAEEFNLEEFEIWVDDLNAAMEKEKDLLADKRELEIILYDLTAVESKIESYNKLDLDQLQVDVVEAQRLVVEAQVVRQDWMDLRGYDHELSRIQDKKFPDLDIIITVQTAIQACEDKQVIQDEVNDLEEIASKLEQADEWLAFADRDIIDYTKQRDEALANVDTCPSCGSKLTAETKKKLLG